MKGIRFLGAGAVAAALLSCHDETILQTFSTFGSGNPPGAPSFTVPVAAAPLSGVHEIAQAMDVGADGQPRLAFTRGTDLLFTRRDALGAWSSPLTISSTAVAKDFVSAWVTSNNDFTHVFWREGSEVHYRRVNNDPLPAFDTADTIVSAGSTTNSPTAAVLTAGTVTALTTAIDRPSATVYALWIQSATNGGGTDDAVPVVGAVVGGTGAVGELFALLMPNGDGTGATSGSPLARVSGGIVHAVWLGSDAAGGSAGFVRHSSRNAASSWSGGDTGNTVSAAAAAVIVDLLLAGDGDAYAIWRDASATPLRARRRPAGAASPFDAEVPLPPTTSIGPVAAALEPGTENLHVFWVTAVETVASAYPAPDLAASAWTGPTTLHAKPSVQLAAWADSTNVAAVAFVAPQTFDTVNHVLLVTRPSGLASLYASPADLTAVYALPVGTLAAGVSDLGDALLVWSQGGGVNPTEIFSALYTSGGSNTPAANVSQSTAPVGSGNIRVQLTGSRVGHLVWPEETSAPNSDLLYSQKP